jgi:hypothetical protein
MELWLKKEQESKFIELWLKETLQNKKDKWTHNHIYVCAHQGTGGKKKYEKKFPDTKWLTNHFMTCHDHIVDQSPVV